MTPAAGRKDRRERPAAGGRRPSPKTAPRDGRSWLLLGLVLLATFVVYLPSLDNEFTNWDDTFYVTDNPLVAHPDARAILTTPVAGNYHPLTILSLALNYRLSGLDPSSYRWLNLLLHLANTALVFLFVRRLSGGAWSPAIVSFFFGVHPMHVESVAWIAERKDVLYAFFYLGGLILYLRYLDSGRTRWLAAAFGAFVLSVASKAAAVVFPVTLVAIDLYRGRRPIGARLLEKTPFFAVSVAAGLLAIHAQKIGGALEYAHAWSLANRLLAAGYGTVQYVLKLFAPFHLSAIYPAPPLPIRLGAEYYVALVALCAGLALAIYRFRRDRDVLFGIAFFLVNIALVIQFFTFGTALMADRYTYIPYIGLFFALSRWTDSSPDRIRVEGAVKTAVAFALLLLAPVSLVQTWKRCDVWQSSLSLWNDTIAKYPEQVDAYHLRGYYYQHAGQAGAALADYDQALSRSPTEARVWNDRGVLFSELGRADSARACFDRAVALRPALADAWNNRGANRGQQGDVAGAASDFSRAIAADPRFRDPYVNRSVAYHMLHDYEKAIADSRQAIALAPWDPDNAGLRDAIGQNLQALNRYREALAEHDAAIRGAAPGDPRLPVYYFNRSLAWRALGERERAVQDALESRRLGGPVSDDYLRKLGAP